MQRAGVGLLLLAGCAGSAPETPAVRFACERGTVLSVRFDDGVALVEAGDGAVLRLPQAPSGSGFRYQTPTHSLVGKGEELIWTVGRMVPETCQAVR